MNNTTTLKLMIAVAFLVGIFIGNKFIFQSNADTEKLQLAWMKNKTIICKLAGKDIAFSNDDSNAYMNTPYFQYNDVFFEFSDCRVK